jgi:RNA polymerase sigma factor (sigma-70 family)
MHADGSDTAGERKMSASENVFEIDVGALYGRYAPMVLRRCRHLLRDEELAADAMQETFVRVLQHRTTLNARYPSSLLYRIATNICLNMLRTKKRRATVSAEPFIDNLADREKVEERVVNEYVLEKVFQSAREDTRMAAQMHYLEEKTLAETAQAVGLSISGVRKRLNTLRRHSEALMAR